MKEFSHSIEEKISQDLSRKMVFLSGPRQIGKTTLAKQIITNLNGIYLLYDNNDDRQIILKQSFDKNGLICLDEFHKYSRWKDYLKGVYDKHKDQLNFLITGSARLDIYQQSGDSLFGRFFLHFLYPLTLAELHQKKIHLISDFLIPHEQLNGLEELMQFGGFPEPFFLAKEDELRRWNNQRRELLIREDLSQLTQITLLSIAEKLMILLPDRIGSLFSYQSLAEDLHISSQTVQNWLYNFERLFIVFKLFPYSKQINRSINKRPKYYLWNWTDITNKGARFENLVALHLYKSVQTWQSLGLANCNLHFIQDRSNKKVDFLVTKEGHPWFLVEVKDQDSTISKNLLFFSKKLNIPGIQLVQKKGMFKQIENCIVCSADRWLGHLQ
jgi:predicted AAA+ superfamily ATPase